MHTTTLTDRYVDAAMRTVPEKQRTDLAAELRASIADQIDPRVEAGVDREAAERAVLNDLGDPDKLAADYTDRPLWLIGPRYFLDWWRLLKLLLWILLPCASLGVAIGTTIAGKPFGEIVGTTAAVLVGAAVHLAFWTTLVFAIVERTSQPSSDDAPVAWSVDQLPEPRPTGASLGDLITGLVFLAVAAGAVLWDHFVGVVRLGGGEWLPFLDPGLWPWWITALFVIMALEAALAITVYAVRRWTVGLAVANGILNLAVALPALWLLFQGRLLNAGFWPSLVPDGQSASTLANIIAILLGFTIAGIAIWDTLDAAIKAHRARQVTRAR